MRLHTKSKYNKFILRKYNVTNNILTLDRILNARVEIYKGFCLDVAQGHMKGAPNDLEC